MKLIHTPLGALASKKKIIASVAALAFVGGIAPTLINNTHAAEGDPYYNPDETFFTVVEPYHTEPHELSDTYFRQGYRFSVADTSIADLYSDEFGCNERYICIQGKKTGVTELIVSKSGENTIRVPLVSVKLSPADNHNRKNAGEQFTVTGSIEGADDSLLTLEDIHSNGEASVTITGDRSALIDASNVKKWGDVDLCWKIGNEYINSCTNYDFLNYDGIDNIYHLPENEEILEILAINTEIAISDYMSEIFPGFTPVSDFDPNIFGDIDITLKDGSVFHIGKYPEEGSNFVWDDVVEDRYQLILESNEIDIDKTEVEKLSAELPDGTKEKKFMNISVSSNYQAKLLDGTIYNEEDGYYKSLASPLTIVVDAPNVEAVADGYTRKWYVVHDNNGTIEKFEAAYDEATKTIRFDTKVFGPHAYGYVDEEIKEEPAGESVVPKVPNTGSPIQKVAQAAAITFAPLTAIVFGAFMIRSKKHADSKLAKKHNHFE